MRRRSRPSGRPPGQSGPGGPGAPGGPGGPDDASRYEHRRDRRRAAARRAGRVVPPAALPARHRGQPGLAGGARHRRTVPGRGSAAPPLTSGCHRVRPRIAPDTSIQGALPHVRLRQARHHALPHRRPARPIDPDPPGPAPAHHPRHADRRPLSRRLPDRRVRARLLLGRGEDVLGAARRLDDGRRLPGRLHAQPDLQGGVHRARPATPRRSASCSTRRRRATSSC